MTKKTLRRPGPLVLAATLGCLFGFAGAARARPTPPAIAPDIDQMLAQFQRVEMPFHSAALSPRERRMVEKLVDASHELEDIYWRQSDPEGLALYKSLEGSKKPEDRKVLRLLTINGSRFDLIQDNKPFVGTAPAPPGRGLYPPGLTRAEIERYVEQHPSEKAAIYSPYTILRWRGKRLEAIPYHVAFRRFLVPAARDLRAAAALASDPAFARFLRMRAEALLTDHYFASDLAWLDLKNPKFDVIFAPYEVYLDGVLGVKTSYGAAVLVRNEEESRRLEMYQKYVPELQQALPLPAAELPSKEGHRTPMEVMDAPFRAGDLRHGYQAVADNLPNDPRIHSIKGSKKIFFKNFMDARVKYIIVPLAGQLMAPAQAAEVTGDGYLTGTILHEISHDLGPAFARTGRQEEKINQAIGPLYSALEESKADVVGMFCLGWLVEHGALPKKELAESYASYVAGTLRTVRFGIAEAHGKGAMMEFNYLAEQGAIRWNAASRRYEIDDAKMPGAIARLAHQLLAFEAAGDRRGAEAWFAKYAVMPATLQQVLARAANVPVDLDPVFSLPEPVR
jgi:hypothetical protein